MYIFLKSHQSIIHYSINRSFIISYLSSFIHLFAYSIFSFWFQLLVFLLQRIIFLPQQVILTIPFEKLINKHLFIIHQLLFIIIQHIDNNHIAIIRLIHSRPIITTLRGRTPRPPRAKHPRALNPRPRSPKRALHRRHARCRLRDHKRTLRPFHMPRDYSWRRLGHNKRGNLIVPIPGWHGDTTVRGRGVKFPWDHHWGNSCRHHPCRGCCYCCRLRGCCWGRVKSHESGLRC